MLLSGPDYARLCSVLAANQMAEDLVAETQTKKIHTVTEAFSSVGGFFFLEEIALIVDARSFSGKLVWRAVKHVET